ncbi:MAG: hypothetical protein HOV96_32490 [Nonomuraea sp.]|nr:hypothetical protein [Nonomuraea sp.]
MTTTAEHDDFQSRLPDPARFFPGMAAIAGAMTKATGNGSIPHATVGLVRLRAGRIVGSTYHTVRQSGLLGKARRDGGPRHRRGVMARRISTRKGPLWTLALIAEPIAGKPLGKNRDK